MSKGGVVDRANAGFEEDRDESLFEKIEECPIRITSIFGFSETEVRERAQKLIDEFGWKYHSVAKLLTIESCVTSIILWNTKS